VTASPFSRPINQTSPLTTHGRQSHIGPVAVVVWRCLAASQRESASLIWLRSVPSESCQKPFGAISFRLGRGRNHRRLPAHLVARRPTVLQQVGVDLDSTFGDRDQPG
jgi:hypothetical protein